MAFLKHDDVYYNLSNVTAITTTTYDGNPCIVFEYPHETLNVVVKGHAPYFLQRIMYRIAHNQTINNGHDVVILRVDKVKKSVMTYTH